MLIVAIVLALLAAALLTLSAAELARADPATSFPLWSDPPRRPRRVIVLGASGGGLAVFSTILAPRPGGSDSISPKAGPWHTAWQTLYDTVFHPRRPTVPI